MENIELIFQDIEVDDLERLLFQELLMQRNKIKRSHFYDNLNEKDLEFHDIASLEEYYSKSGTGNILLEEIEIGSTILSDAMVIISFDKQWGDVVINFSITDIQDASKCVDINRLEAIIKKIELIVKNINVKKVLLGYEPAEDEDMLIYSIDKNGNQVKNHSVISEE